MNRSSSLFSVVLPTRNRATLLPLAIKSVLAQSYPDFELIVSDNFSSDNTPEVVRSFGDSRISYVRTTESLSMIESWRFALTHARGEFITFLSDDDAFAVNLLERAKSIVDETKTKLLCWRHAYYYPDEYRSQELPLYHPLRRIEKNSLVIPAFCSRLLKVDSTLSLKRALLNDSSPSDSLLEPEPLGPLFTNAIYHRDLLEKVKECRIDLLRKNVVPDIYAAYATSLLAGSYFFLNEPLTIFCIHGSSATANYAAEKTSLAKQFEESPGREHELLTPIKNFLNRNYYLNSILQAQHDVGRGEDGPRLDRKNYFLMYHAEMMSYQARGADTSEELEEFNSTLALEPESLQAEVRAAISTSRSSIIRPFIRKLPRPSLLTKTALRLKPNMLHHRSILVSGEDAGFGNIAECAGWLDAEMILQLSDFCLNTSQGRFKPLPFKWKIG